MIHVHTLAVVDVVATVQIDFGSAPPFGGLTKEARVYLYNQVQQALLPIVTELAQQRVEREVQNELESES